MTYRPMHAQHPLIFLRRRPRFLRFLSGTGTGVVGFVGMGVPAGAQRSGVFAMDSDGGGRASETVCSSSGLAVVSSRGVGLESSPLSPVPFPFSNVAVVGIVACLRVRVRTRVPHPVHTFDQNELSTILWKYPTEGSRLGEHTPAGEAFRCVEGIE